MLHSLVEVVGVLSRGGTESCAENGCDGDHSVAKMALDHGGEDLGMEDDQDAFSGDANAFAKVTGEAVGLAL